MSLGIVSQREHISGRNLTAVANTGSRSGRSEGYPAKIAGTRMLSSASMGHQMWRSR